MIRPARESVSRCCSLWRAATTQLLPTEARSSTTGTLTSLYLAVSPDQLSVVDHVANSLLAIIEGDAALVHKNVATKNHNISYEARLISIQGERLAKPRKVYCYVSPKQLTIKELILKFIPKRLVTFRLCPSTKVWFSRFFYVALYIY